MSQKVTDFLVLTGLQQRVVGMQTCTLDDPTVDEPCRCSECRALDALIVLAFIENDPEFASMRGDPLVYDRILAHALDPNKN